MSTLVYLRGPTGLTEIHKIAAFHADRETRELVLSKVELPPDLEDEPLDVLALVYPSPARLEVQP